MNTLNISSMKPIKDTEMFESSLEHIKFTLSVSPELVRGNLDILESEYIIERFRRAADRIYDINFTCHIDPFIRDAHGVTISREENNAHLRQMLRLQEAVGITVSPVFNNIFVPNTHEMLRCFVENLKPLVDMGIHSITVPHVLWLKMGLLQKTFPHLNLKNTVLRRVRTAQDFWNHAEAGCDYVNIDRVLVRDLTELRQIRKAQKTFEQKYGKQVVTSLLHGEGCLGTCALFEEHYLHTITHANFDRTPEDNIKLFRLPQQYSCLAVGDTDYNFLISAGLPYFREDLEEICRYFDVIKLAGRRSFHSLGDCLSAAENFASNDDLLIPGAPAPLHRMLTDKSLSPYLEKWRQRIKDCRFQCWQCKLCSEIYARLI